MFKQCCPEFSVTHNKVTLTGKLQNLFCYVLTLRMGGTECSHWEGLQVQFNCLIFSSVQSLSHVQLFTTPWTAARQASRSITNSQSLLKLMSIEMVMPSNHLILCHPLLLSPSIFPTIRVFSNESAIPIKWPKFQLQHKSFQ